MPRPHPNPDSDGCWPSCDDPQPGVSIRQARNLVRAGEANLVGTGRLVHGVMLVRRLHRGTAALTLGDGVLASGR